MKRLPTLLLLLACSACALSAPPASEWVGREPSVAAGHAPDLAELDRAAAEALAASAAAPDDAGLALRAAQSCFLAADLRLQSGSVAALDELAQPTLEQVLRAGERLPEALRTEILSQATAGLEAADRAAARTANVRADLVAGTAAIELARGQHLALIAWANGPARSLFAGYGPKLVAAIDACVAADPTFDHAAPLRLEGRFRGEAPRPFGDLARARKALERAVELAPLCVNRLFLGDVLWRANDHAGAEREWRAASTADGDASTRASTPFLQELARRRLAALARVVGG